MKKDKKESRKKAQTEEKSLMAELDNLSKKEEVVKKPTKKKYILKKDLKKSADEDKKPAVKVKPQLVDKTKMYDLKEAIDLLKKICKTKFVSSVELHINTTEKGIKQKATLPFGTGKKVKVAVVDDQILKDIEAGKIDFDILIAHPSFMPKLAKLAKILGPKGLMPNPKNGTVTPDTEKAIANFSKGQIQIKTEADFPLIHQLIGKINMETKELTANIQTVIEAVKKNRIKTAYLSGTMTPSVKLDIAKI